MPLHQTTVTAKVLRPTDVEIEANSTDEAAQIAKRSVRLNATGHENDEEGVSCTSDVADAVRAGARAPDEAEPPTRHYNHAFTFAFEHITDNEEGDVTPAEARAAIVLALARLTDSELLENLGAPYDTFETDK